ncbi:hypothetical protein AALA61_13170 [Oscillospiraceae bacterium 42-9]
MKQKECINKYRTLQDYSFLNMPCPRCGKQTMKAILAENALGRHEEIYVCPDCGTEEALEDYGNPCEYRDELLVGEFCYKKQDYILSERDCKACRKFARVGKCC